MGGNNSCCWMRELDVWWKVPKGLPTNIVCDNCGVSWREYTELNVRPMREKLLEKSKVAECKETLLNSTSAKWAKVCYFLRILDSV